MLDEVRLSDQDLRDIDKIFVVACGTAYHAGLIAKYAIEHWTRIPVEVELASEFRYRDPVLDRSTLVVVISQSGETMDTLMALRHAKDQKARVLAICNANGSTIPRESDAVLYTHAGPEIAVASTKGFLTQLVACYLVGALPRAGARASSTRTRSPRSSPSCGELPDAVAEVLEQMEPVRELAPRRWPTPTGAVPRPARRLPGGARGRAQAQGAGLHPRRGLRRRRAQARPDRGDRRGHCRSSSSSRRRAAATLLHGKVVSNIQEVRARGARTIVIAEEGDEDVVPYADHLIRVPRTPTLLAPVVTTVPLQVLACEIADSPRPGRRPAPQPGQVRHRRVRPLIR